MANEYGHTLSANPNRAIGDVITAGNVLEKIYCEEIDALKKPDTRGYKDLQGRKWEAAEAYYAVMEKMIARKEELKNLDPATKKRLRVMHKRFSTTTQQNLQEIQRMKKCSQRLGNTLRNAAIRAAKKTGAVSYSGNGSLNNERSHKIISSSLNEKI